MSEATAVLHAKRDGRELDPGRIREFVLGITDHSVTDAQLGAFAMAVCLSGMTMAEQVCLTLAMRDSGAVLEWPEMNGPILDKHSTGGVGDMVSLVLGPLLAACGAYVPMISGRGLGHTGGTLDKLESIPGFDVHPGLEEFQRIVRQTGVAIIGQTHDLAPADRRLYATRDITCTMPSVPLIVSSILSKKLAEGLDGLVLDVKTGNGAFMRERHQAVELARQLAQVSSGAGLPCSALLSDMSQPLAWSAGNALEVRETIAFLTRQPRHPRLEAVILALGAAALRIGGLEDSAAAAERRLRRALDDGTAAECFARMVASQGGPGDLLEAPGRHFPDAPVRRPVLSPAGGYVRSMATLQIGLAVMRLGGGRQRVEDKIDARVGLAALCSVGDRVEKGGVLAEVHAASDTDGEMAATILGEAIDIGPDPVPKLPCIYDRFEAD
jgi:thymidine phosphorylase